MHPQMLQDLSAARRNETMARAERNRMVAEAREARRSRGGSPAESGFLLAGALKFGRAVRRLGSTRVAPVVAPVDGRTVRGSSAEDGCATC